MLKQFYRKIVPMKYRIRINQYITSGSKKKCLSNLLEMRSGTEFANVENEIDYVLSIGECVVFPYAWVSEYSNVDIKAIFDGKKHMYYIVTQMGRKLYFPSTYKEQDVIRYYRSMLVEQDSRSPHRYFSSFDLENMRDICFVDVGAAEGFISLSIIEKIDKLILIERSEEWIKALKATFGPWKEKVSIIQKYAGCQEKENVIRIDSLKVKNVYLKMDVEGMELEVLQGAQGHMQSNIRGCYVCAYHKHNHADEISVFLNKFGFEIETSDGYMLICNKGIPDFRKGMIRARKNENFDAG